jgi:stage II sporulation protein D
MTSMARPPRPPTLVAAGLAAAALAATAAPVAAAPAAPDRVTVFSFIGRGFGHGVGMSQYGARGAALAGWDAQRILAHYYRGAQPASIRNGSVRVRIAGARRRVVVRSATPWRIVDESAVPAPPRTLPAGSGAVVTSRPGGVVVSPAAGAGPRYVVPGPLRFEASGPEAAVALGQRPYRGVMRIVPAGSIFDVINVVGIEKYLWGVLPREVPADWGDDTPAVLEAQAVAARSYAVASLRPDRTYDLETDERSQVYGGVAGEDPRTTAAVKATRGRVLAYDGRVITAFFFSTSGGRTEDGQIVFPSDEPRPYLRSVADPFDRVSPVHVWPDRPTFTGRRLGALLGVGAPVTRLQVLRRGRSPRVIMARVVTTAGARVDVSGAEIRRVLGLRDTWFTVARRVVSRATAARLTTG